MRGMKDSKNEVGIQDGLRKFYEAYFVPLYNVYML